MLLFRIKKGKNIIFSTSSSFSPAINRPRKSMILCNKSSCIFTFLIPCIYSRISLDTLLSASSTAFCMSSCKALTEPQGIFLSSEAFTSHTTNLILLLSSQIPGTSIPSVCLSISTVFIFILLSASS